MYTICLCKMLKESKHTCLANVRKNVSEKQFTPIKEILYFPLEKHNP